MQPGANIYQVFERLCRAASHIETVVKFAHDKHLGYITSCPTNLGTALRGSVHIKLPLLSQQKDQFQAIADKYYVQIRGIHGEHSESDDGVFDISNRRRLGRSEKQLVQDMIDGVRAMIDAEKALQKSGHHGKIGKFNSAEELNEFKTLFPPGSTDSALSRNLTE